MSAPDPASPLAKAVKAALRSNEIGNGNPYALSFAGLGQSGPSFGVFQADMAVNHQAQSTFFGILVTAGIDGQISSEIRTELARPMKTNPLSVEQQALVNAAMNSPKGRAAIDDMDGITFVRVLDLLGTSIDAAAAVGLKLETGAAIAIALWVNMTGAPNTLNRWLGGEAVTIDGVDLAPPSGPVVSQADIEGYLAHTQFFEQHARNLAHFEASVEVGLFEPTV